MAAQQQRQKVELLGRQVDTLVAPVGAVAAGVQLKVGDPERGRRQVLLAAPQQAANACQQFGKFERLEQVVVGAQVQALDPIREPAVGGQHHDAGRGLRPQALQHAPAVELRQVDVEDDQVVGVLAGQVQAVNAGGGAVDDVAVLAQALLQVLGSTDFVFDDQ